MVVQTVRVQPPKGYKAKRYMNAGMAIDMSHYYRAEENEQIDTIVKALLRFTKGMSYQNGVIHAYPCVENSQNTNEIKRRIMAKYCEQKIAQ